MITNSLLLLSSLRVVHADLKPDNILIEFTEDNITGLKLIDFGSAFFFDQVGVISVTTPEYMPPEVLAGVGVGNNHEIA